MRIKVPTTVKLAASRFSSKRADYYSYVAQMLRSADGNIKPMQLLENDIFRFGGQPRGVLSSHWHAAYSSNGGKFAQALRGTMPDDEVAIIEIGENAGDEGLLEALDDVSRIAKMSDKIKSDAKITLLAGFIGLSIALLMLTVFPIFSVGMLRSSYDFLPLEAWGKVGQSYYRYAERVKTYWSYAAIGILLLAFYVNWTIANLTSTVRDWLDRNIALYRVIRDIKGALFLSTMSTLTRRRGGVMFTERESLEAFANSVESPWMKWRVTQIMENSDRTGSIGTKAFKTGFFSAELYFYLEDMQNARGFAKGFEETGKYVESTVMASISKKLNVYRWAMLMTGIVATMYVFAYQFRVIYEMRGAMSIFMNSPTT